MSEEFRGSFLSEVTLEKRRRRVTQIDQDQAIERVAKFRVDVEAEQFAAETEILFEENRNALAIGLDVRGHG